MENYKEITEVENIEIVAEPQLALWQGESVTNKNDLQVIKVPQKNIQNYNIYIFKFYIIYILL